MIRPTPLRFTHVSEVANLDQLAASFSCGVSSIDQFFREAIAEKKQEIELLTNMFVFWNDTDIIGFFTVQNDATAVAKNSQKNTSLSPRGWKSILPCW